MKSRAALPVWSILAAVAVLLLGGVFQRAGDGRDLLWNTIWNIISSTCYIGLIFGWSFSLRRRILRREIRSRLIVCCRLMAAMILLRFAKYYLFDGCEGFRRMLWYLYYVPVLFATTFSFLAAVCLGTPEEKKTNWRWNLVCIPAALLVLAILTNDRHQLAFRFQEGFAGWNSSYVHGPVFYATCVWSVALLLLSVAAIYRRSTIASSRRLAWVPMALLAAGYAATYGAFLDRLSLFEVPELLCFTFAMFWEGCLQIGLLPSNREYAVYFRHSGLSARIMDNEGQIRYCADALPGAESAQREDVRVNRAAIAGGCIEWEDDLGQIRRMNARLEEMQERLSQQAELTRAENEIKEKRARMEEKSRLYDQICRFARPYLSMVQRDLERTRPEDADFLREMTCICVRGAYVKRRSNLTLLLSKSAMLHSEELKYCLRESIEYMEMTGGAFSVTEQGAGWYAGEQLLAAYDFFEEILETLLPGPAMLMIHLRCEKMGFSLRIVMEEPCVFSPGWEERLGSCGGRLERNEQDDVCYTTLCFAKEETA